MVGSHRLHHHDEAHYDAEQIADIKKGMRPFERSSSSAAWWHMSTTLAALICCTAALKYTALAVLPLPFIVIRTFIVFHDLGHRSFFPNTAGGINWNALFASMLAPICCFQEDDWREGHNEHHKVHGNKCEVDSTKTVVTVREYQNWPWWGRLAYRVLRAPVVFFTILPAVVFYLKQFVKVDYIAKYAALMFGLHSYGGVLVLQRFVLGQYIGVVLGTCVFHLQHQVNTGYWKEFDTLDKHRWEQAQLHGSSMLQIPSFLKWAFFGIEYHHIHHLSTRVPAYNMQRCHDHNAKLFGKVTSISMAQAFLSMFHVFFDEATETYISFPLAASLGLQA